MNTSLLHFIPWMRRGLATLLAGDANEYGAPVGSPPAFTVSVTVGVHEVARVVRLQGPEAVIGINSAQVLRCYPDAEAVDFEPNDFVHVALQPADLPWMFTPSVASDGRLLPWLVLVVVEEREGVAYSPGDPLPVLQVDDAERELPDLHQAYAWGHVQTHAAFDGDVEATYEANPEAFVARLVAPRRLQGGTWYRACVVPGFRSGREAGLGRAADPEDVALAWEKGALDVELPVYYSWRFRTAVEEGDFESLVSRLKAYTLPPEVGMHELNIGNPGSAALPRALGVSIGYRGVFLSPQFKQPEWPAKHRSAFREGLQKMLNEGVVERPVTEKNAYDPLLDDPVVAPPMYGAVPADAGPLKLRSQGWMESVNLDPANRTVAGLGASLVRRLQETLMAEAWDQAAAVREANAVLNRARFALEVGKRLDKRVASLDDGHWLQWSKGVHGRLRLEQKTLRGVLEDSVLPNGSISNAFRRRFHPGTTLSRAHAVAMEKATASLSTTLTKEFVKNPVAIRQLAGYTIPRGVVWQEGYAPVAESGGLRDATYDGSHYTAVQVDRVRRVQGRRLTTSKLRLRAGKQTDTSLTSDVLSSSTHTVVLPSQGSGTSDLSSTLLQARKAMDPEQVLAARVRAIIQPSTLLGDASVPAGLQVDPLITRPLYEDLARRDPELLMPGVNQLPKDSVALARLNTDFVEALLLGANHELGREFLWREFPADLRGTWLRTFWDAVVLDEGAFSNVDIAPIRDWKQRSKLGTHCTLDPERTMVLVIKGDVLQRYPDTLIYATPARWAKDEEGHWERVENADGTPVYPSLIGKLTDDVTFIGLVFDPLDGGDVETMLRGTPAPPGLKVAVNPGWFFAFEQLPEEPHFGFDVEKSEHQGKVPARWEQLSWGHAMGEAATAYVDLDVLTASNKGVPPEKPYDDEGANAAWMETWAENAAAMARITWQRPVRVLMHADQMLMSPLPVTKNRKR